MAERSLLVLLLPGRLEDLPRRDLAESLLAGPAAVAVEPGRVALARLPAGPAALLAGMQAKRMRLPGRPRALVLLGDAAYPLARALLARHADCELWYAPEPGAGGELDALARARATLVFEDTDAGRSAVAAAIAAAGLEPS